VDQAPIVEPVALPETPEKPEPDERFMLNPTDARFLFVEVAAQRAKQLRRGALSRLRPADADPGRAPEPPAPARKPERVAMDEVRQGYIQYDFADAPPSHPKLEGLL